MYKIRNALEKYKVILPKCDAISHKSHLEYISNFIKYTMPKYKQHRTEYYAFKWKPICFEEIG